MYHHRSQNKDAQLKAQEEHKAREEEFQREKGRKQGKKKKIIAVCGMVAFIFAAVGAYAMLSPGKYDSFAKCLSEKGAVMYGEDWCPYTNGQKAMFGKSFKYINYHVKKDLRLRPTWVIGGETYETVQSFQRLAELTGCEYQGIR